MTDSDSRRRLADSLREAIEASQKATSTEADRKRARLAARARRQRPLRFLAIAAWAVLAWLWIAQPRAIFDPLAVGARSPEEVEASLRYALYLQASRIRMFEADSGRLPRSLEEAGHVEAGIIWVRTDQGWVLTGREGDLDLQFTHRMAADSFLGSSLSVLQR